MDNKTIRFAKRFLHRPDNSGRISKKPENLSQTENFESSTAVPPRREIGKSGQRADGIEGYFYRLESILLRRLLIVGVLGVMVMIGLFLSNYSISTARYYWSAMFPIFGLACLAHELATGRARVVPLWRILLRQTLHWMVPIVAVEILFLQHARGQMSLDAVALAIIVVLAVTCFLAGLHFDHSFYWVSAFLALAAVVGTEIETYLWILAVLAFVAAAIALLSAALLRGHGSEVGSTNDTRR